MPGWYIHPEAAKLAADRLRAGDIPADLGLDPADLGPDLFFMLPDFKAPPGSQLLNIAEV